MSEPRLTDLLDRAVHEAPPMHLDTDALLAAGKGRVRRRRATGAGLTAGALALGAAVLAGLGGGAELLTGPPAIQPATTVWEQGEAVDVTLFSGYSTIDVDAVEHSFDARLTRSSLGGPVVLEVSDGGALVERITAASPVPGLEVFRGESMTVALWAEPDGVVSSVPLVGPVDPGGPAGRHEGPEISGQSTAYAVWPAGVTGLAVPDEVLDVYLVGTEEVAALSGAEVSSAELRAGGQRALAWSDPAAGVWGYAVGDPAWPFLQQLGGQPAQTSGYVGAEEDVVVAVQVLPEGATVLPDQVPDARFDSAVLDGRAVVLAESRGQMAPDVRFRLGEQDYTAESYQDDLHVLDLGEPLAPAEAAEPGGLELVTVSGERAVLTLGAPELDEGLLTRTIDGRPVVVAAGWDTGADVLTSARVEVGDGAASRWTVPGDVAQTVLPDGRVVTVLSVDLSGDEQVLAVGRQDGGEVHRWDPPVVAAGVEWRSVDGVPVPFVDGRPLAPVEGGSLGPVRHYVPEEGSSNGYLVLPGLTADTTFVPLVLDAAGDLQPAPDLVHQVDQLETDDGQSTVLTVVGGLGADGRSAVVGVAVQSASDGAANTWQVVGDAASAHVVLDPGVVVSVGAEQGVWLLYPTGSIDPAELEAGRVGLDVRHLSVDTDAGPATVVVAVHPEDTSAPTVGTSAGDQPPTQTHQIDERGLTVRLWTLDGSTG